MPDKGDDRLSQRVDLAIAEYLELVDSGTPPDRETFLARHAGIGDELREFFGNYSDVNRTAPRFGELARPAVNPNDAIRAVCPQGHPLRIAIKLAGRRVKCPKCQAPLVVPDLNPSVPGLVQQEGERSNAIGETLDFKVSNDNDTSTFGSSQILPGSGPLPQPGQRFGRFDILALVGEGAFGAVYRARSLQLDRDVALKLPRPGTLNRSEEVARFLREAQAAAQLHHPHIVSVYEAGQVEGTYYIASAYIAGESLRQQLKQCPPHSAEDQSEPASGWRLTSREVAILISKLASALHYAHQKGIFHRDVKPENIMLDAAQQPFLMDFGLARRLEGDTLRTTEGVKMGTPAYMSPEQAKGASHLADARSDMWSLGVILYELLAGRLPFQTQQLELLLAEIIALEPESPRKLDASISKDLETICLKCLAKEPVRRYPSCQHLADELERWLAGEPITARPIGIPEQAWRWVKRRPAIGALSAALLLLVGGVVVVAPIVAVKQSLLRSEAATLLTEKTEIVKRLNSTLAERDLSIQQQKETVQKLDASLHDLDAALRQQRTAEEQTNQLNGRLQDAVSHLSPQLAAAMFEFAVAEYQAGRIPAALARLGKAYAVAPADLPLRASARRLLVAWSVPTDQLSEPLGRSMRHASAINDAAFSPDGKLIVAGCHDGTLQLWDTHSQEPRSEPIRNGARVSRVAFSPDGRRWLSVGENRTIRWWNVETQTPIVPPIAIDSKILGSGFSPNGRLVMAASSERVQFWEAENGQPFGEPIKPEQGTLVGVQFSPDPDKLRLVTGSSDGTVQVWDALTGQPIGTRLHVASQVSSLAYAPAGNFILIGTASGQAHMWDMLGGNVEGTAFNHDGLVHLVSSSRDGRTVLTATEHAALIWNLATGQREGEPLVHPAGIIAADMSPDSQTVLTRCDDGSVYLWDTASCQPLGRLHPQRGGITDAAFNPDGTSVATASDDGSLQLWKLPQAIADDPALVQEWVEAHAHLTVNDRGQLEKLPPDHLSPMENRLQTLPNNGR